jgi:hypothetical protein
VNSTIIQNENMCILYMLRIDSHSISAHRDGIALYFKIQEIAKHDIGRGAGRLFFGRKMGALSPSAAEMPAAVSGRTIAHQFARRIPLLRFLYLLFFQFGHFPGKQLGHFRLGRKGCDGLVRKFGRKAGLGVKKGDCWMDGAHRGSPFRQGVCA